MSITEVRASTGRGSSLMRWVLRRLPLAGTVIGFGLAGWLVSTNDLGAIGTTFARIGPWALGAIVLVRMVVIFLCGIGWSRILRHLAPVADGPYVMLRFVRDGINTLLPVASVGGDVAGGRLLTFWGVPGAFAAASILVDLLLQAGTLVVFALIGVALLMQVEGDAAASLARWALNALVIMAVVLAAFFAFQRAGAVGMVARLLDDLGRRLSRDDAPAQDASKAAAASVAGDVQHALDAVWAKDRRSSLAQSVLLHLGAWLLGAFEIWIALACIGIDGVGFAEATVIEALTQAIKTAAFPVPSGLGVQEGGFVLVGSLFGLDAGTALALSLVKRVPDVVLGLPSLVLWQSLEARRATVMPPPTR